jgi:hypothetical protein
MVPPQLRPSGRRPQGERKPSRPTKSVRLASSPNIANAMRLGVNVSFIPPDGKPVVGQPVGTAAR